MWVDPSLEKIDAVFVNVRAWPLLQNAPCLKSIILQPLSLSDLVQLPTFELRFSNIYSALCCEAANIFSPPQSD